MFGSKISPYDISDKVIDEVEVYRVEDNNPSIYFDDIENQAILGDNRYIASSGTNAYSAKYLITANNNLFDEVYNYIGTTDGEIKIGFGCPAVKRMRIRNEYNISDTNKSAGDHVMFLPFISKQTMYDNSGKNFNKKDKDSTSMNNEETIQYKGKPTLYYYYGVSTSNFQQKTPTIGSQCDYFFTNFDDSNQKFGICSPFALVSYRDNINEVLANAGLNPTGSTNDVNVMLASYMQSIYLMMGHVSGVTNTREFSLVFANNNDFGGTLYTKFHSNKYRRYQQSEILETKIRFNNNDWRIMQINQPVMYKNQIYSILEISNYNVVKETAKVKLIKQL